MTFPLNKQNLHCRHSDNMIRKQYQSLYMYTVISSSILTTINILNHYYCQIEKYDITLKIYTNPTLTYIYIFQINLIKQNFIPHLIPQ